MTADVDTYLSDDDAAPRPPWTVTTEDEAAWAADKVLTLRQRRDRIVAQCRAAMDAAQRDVERAEGFFLPLLENWARLNPPQRGRTIHLPTAQLAFRRVPGGPRVVDDAATLEWARAALPDAVMTRTLEMLDKAAVKAYVQASGELPPGVEVKPDDETFSVK